MTDEPKEQGAEEIDQEPLEDLDVVDQDDADQVIGGRKAGGGQQDYLG